MAAQDEFYTAQHPEFALDGFCRTPYQKMTFPTFHDYQIWPYKSPPIYGRQIPYLSELRFIPQDVRSFFLNLNEKIVQTKFPALIPRLQMFLSVRKSNGNGLVERILRQE